MNSNSLLPQISHSNAQLINSTSDVPTLRLYQVWKGRNRFCFGGRLIFGPDVKSLFFTVLLIVTPATLFCTFVPRSLIESFPYHLGILVVVICAAFTVYVISILLLTSSRDPGIVPRNPNPPEDESDSSRLCDDWAGSQNGFPSLPPTKDVVLNGTVVKVKYCQTCMLYRPPRCSHCSICNNCVERFDHHCPWVGQCIGKRNYRLFFMFVSSTTMLCLYVFSFCWVSIRTIMQDDHCDLLTAFLRSPISGLLVVYTFLASWFVGGLTIFHLYLILTNQTTYENFRYRYGRKKNPYNLGCARNFWNMFCTEIPVSRNNFRAKVIAYKSNTPLSPSIVSLGGATMSSEDTSSDIEMGKRHGVDAEDIEDIRRHMDSIRVLERYEIQPRQHMTCSKNYKPDWETSLGFSMLPDDFAKECDQMEGM